MSTSTWNEKTVCFTCNKEKIFYLCRGCSKQFCINDLNEHLHSLSIPLGNVENECDQFYELLDTQKNDPKNLLFIEEIDKSEEDSILKIKQTAEKCRLLVRKQSNDHFIGIEKKLFKMAEQIKYSRKENEFNEIHIQQWKTKLVQLKQELDTPWNIKIQQESTCLINDICVVVSPENCEIGKSDSRMNRMNIICHKF